MRNYNLKAMGKKILIRGLLSAFLLFGGKEAIANSNLAKKLEQEPVIEQTLEEKVKSKIDINVNYKLETNMRGVDYSTSRSAYSREGYYKGQVKSSPNILELTNDEMLQVGNLIENVQDKTINSYQEFIRGTTNFSEGQKLILLNAMLGSMYGLNYIRSNEKVASQDTSFAIWQDSLASGDKNGIGECDHLAYSGEQSAEDMGIKEIDVVSGGTSEETGHYYLILKTEDGSAVIDSSNLLISDTKNIEKTLLGYQKYRGIPVFQHFFYDDAKFKYRLITKDGKHFLDFINYDESSKPLKDIMVNGINPQQTDLKITLDFEKYLSSFELNYKGLFVKAGEIRGDISSPLNNIKLYQGGYKRKFSIFDFVNIDGNLSIISGLLHQDKQENNDEIFGVNGGLVAATNRKKGFNFGSRVAGTGIFLDHKCLFYDFVTGAGISYKLPIKNISIEPYVTTQWAGFVDNIGVEKGKLKFSELNVGGVFGIKAPDNTKLSIEPYYLRRIWEQEVGGNIKFEGRNFGINAGVYATESNYEFCPDKEGYNIGLVGRHKKLEIKINYINEKTKYDDEIDNKELIEVNSSLIF